jgi:tRNA U34 2-thiouridine synthase MnmA/TrmU
MGPSSLGEGARAGRGAAAIALGGFTNEKMRGIEAMMHTVATAKTKVKMKICFIGRNSFRSESKKESLNRGSPPDLRKV